MLIVSAFAFPINYSFNNTTNYTKYLGGCSTTPFGCCKDNNTFCMDNMCSNCNMTNYTKYLGGCSTTPFGCCKDNNTFCMDNMCSNCNMTNYLNYH